MNSFEAAGRLGRPYRFVPSCGSSNDLMKAWAAEGAPEGALIVADAQSAGRGRWGRRWESAPGENLLFTLLLKPGRHGVALGVALKRCARALGVPAQLKWPNDLHASGRKLSGMLLEGGSHGVVAGIGLNVNQRGFPPELNAGSLALELGRPLERAGVLRSFLLEAEACLAMEPAALRREWEASACFMGERVQAGVHRGVMRGLAEDGGLLVETAKGLQTLASGDVERLRLDSGA